MNELINKYLELNKKKKEVEIELNEVKKELKLNMRSDNLTTFNGDRANVFYTEVKRSNLDKEKLKEYIKEEDLKECYKESSYDRLDIKEK